MVTLYKPIKSENFKFSVSWILGFDDLQDHKNPKTQKLNKQEVDLSMLRKVPKPPNSKISDFEI